MIYITGSYKQTIKCPECDTVQEATVETTNFWDIHAHECTNCKYLITESEWQVTDGKIEVKRIWL